MASVTGYIKYIDERETSVGTMYDVNIDGTKIGVGKFAPKGFSVGDYVTATFTEKGKYKNLDRNGLVKATAPADGGPKPTSGISYNAGAANDLRQDTISKQAASNTAIAWINVLVTVDALPVVKASKDKKADLMDELRRKYTAEFYHLATGKEMPVEALDAPVAADELPTSWDE